MKDKLIFSGYILLVIIITSFHGIYFLSGLLIILSVLSGPIFIKLLKKSFVTIIYFNLIITVSYATISIIDNNFSFEYIILINLRVMLLSLLTHFVVEKINMFTALSFSSTLSYILVLASSQIIEFKKVYSDFKLALKSRTLEKLESVNLYRYISSLTFFFLNKSLHNSREISEAMKSRGFLND